MMASRYGSACSWNWHGRVGDRLGALDDNLTVLDEVVESAGARTSLLGTRGAFPHPAVAGTIQVAGNGTHGSLVNLQGADASNQGTQL